MDSKKIYGLIGKNISYSFSESYFSEKFTKLQVNDSYYRNFDLPDLSEFAAIRQNPLIKGLNVTIPYKEQIMQHLDFVDPIALKIGAVNTIKFSHNQLTGYNTDYFGFTESLKPLLQSYHQKALILGTGGAAKAVAYSLQQLDIEYLFVSRTPLANTISYEDLDSKIMNEYLIIINCTPLGTFPDIDQKPPILYQYLSSQHLLYDLIYNPSITSFLQQGIDKNCTTINGYEMLVLQAEKSYEIWNSSE